MSDSTKGKWGDLIPLKNVPVHVSLLPNGKVLYWGRRRDPKAVPQQGMNDPFTNVYIFDPVAKTDQIIVSPKLPDGKDMNIFCSGHTFQHDGSLLVSGGHLSDGEGLNQACVYSFDTNQWSAKKPMVEGRWYPSNRALPDGRVFTVSGSAHGYVPVIIPQIWHADDWVDVSAMNFPLYPRTHLTPDGRIFVSGPQKPSFVLNVTADAVNEKGVKVPGIVGQWKPGPNEKGPERTQGHREYAPSVMYDRGKIMFIGGGNDPPSTDPSDQSKRLPTNIVEFIDLNLPDEKWAWTSSEGSNMNSKRQQHNATILPDGTVFVTGGSKGTGWNNLNPSESVLVSELFNPKTKSWTDMDAEKVRRCYHSTALLLPDGQVFSGGGGEYDTTLGEDNNLTNAQLYKPPYFFKNPRPTITNAPKDVKYGQPFEVTVGTNDKVKNASWIGLGSVTHANNFNQSIMFLNTLQKGTKVTVTPPANAIEAPPGYYMLFLLSDAATPLPSTMASFVKIGPVPTPPAKVVPSSAQQKQLARHTIAMSAPQLNEKIISEQNKSVVAVGLTPLCYYGLGPCWGGAYTALQRLSNIDVVRPIPSQADSLAYVYLKDDGIIPDVDVWRKEFEATASGAYIMRGIDMTISGQVHKQGSGSDEQLTLVGTKTRPDILLKPFQQTDQISWDKDKQVQRPITDAEAAAYTGLLKSMADIGEQTTVHVTGSLEKLGDDKFSLHVRSFVTAMH